MTAALHLHTPLFVVLGHGGCGAVAAAAAAKWEGAREAARITLLLEGIVPGLDGVNSRLDPAARIAEAIEANVRWSMRQLLATPEAQARLKEGLMRLVGAVYEIATGHVRFLS